MGMELISILCIQLVADPSVGSIQFMENANPYIFDAVPFQLRGTLLLILY